MLTLLGLAFMPIPVPVNIYISRICVPTGNKRVYQETIKRNIGGKDFIIKVGDEETQFELKCDNDNVIWRKVK